MMTLVQDYYHYVQKESGREVASQFIILMNQWDGGTIHSTYNAFYEDDLLAMKHKEAREAVEQGL